VIESCYERLNKVAHLFPVKHNLGSLVTKHDGQENTIKAVLKMQQTVSFLQVVFSLVVFR
jgi:hypothetical protein